MDDDRVYQAVRDQLEADQVVDTSGITVSVYRGRVTVHGVVTSADEKWSVTVDAVGVRGVHGVDNQLQVHFPR